MTQTRHDLVLPAVLASSPAISPLLIQFQPPGSSWDIPKHANFAPISVSALVLSAESVLSGCLCVTTYFTQLWRWAASGRVR